MKSLSLKVSQGLVSYETNFEWRRFFYMTLRRCVSLLKSSTSWCFMHSYSTEWLQINIWWKHHQSGQYAVILFSSRGRRCNISILQATEDLSVDIHLVVLYSSAVNTVGSQWIASSWQSSDENQINELQEGLRDVVSGQHHMGATSMIILSTTSGNVGENKESHHGWAGKVICFKDTQQWKGTATVPYLFKPNFSLETWLG